MKTIVIALVLAVCVAPTAGALAASTHTHILGLFPGPDSACFGPYEPKYRCALENVEQDLAWIDLALFSLGEGRIGGSILLDVGKKLGYSPPPSSSRPVEFGIEVIGQPLTCKECSDLANAPGVGGTLSYQPGGFDYDDFDLSAFHAQADRITDEFDAFADDLLNRGLSEFMDRRGGGGSPSLGVGGGLHNHHFHFDIFEMEEVTK